MIVCTKCGLEVPEGTDVCTECVSPETTITAEPVQLKATALPVTSVLSGPDPETGGEVIRVAAPGAQSEMRRGEDGSIYLSVQGAEGVGRTGERRVMWTFRHRLREAGLKVSFELGRDEYGEDAKLRVGTDTFTFQVVTAPPAADFWRDASVGSTTTQVDVGHAAGWLGKAVSEKARTISPAQLAETVLAIDAQHAGLLAGDEMLEAYLADFGDPSSVVGFSSVWVVGPRTKYCSRIGNGTP